MFITRLLSGIVLMIIAAAGFYLGSPVLTVILYAIALIGYRELANALGVSKTAENAGVDATGTDTDGNTTKMNAGVKPASTEIIGYLGVTLYYGLMLLYDLGVLKEQKFTVLMAVICLVFLAEMFAYVFEFGKYKAEHAINGIFAFLYAPLMLSFVDMTRAEENGRYLVWLILICSWGCDTCAYCVGKLIGKKKIFPVLSPKKSLEGCIGGVAGAAILGALYAQFAMGRPAAEVGLIALISAFGALASMVGDLAASAIKRNKGIKDYGKLIPGHGGIMDRFDSVIVTAPMVYFLIVLFM